MFRILFRILYPDLAEVAMKKSKIFIFAQTLNFSKMVFFYLPQIFLELRKMSTIDVEQLKELFIRIGRKFFKSVHKICANGAYFQFDENSTNTFCQGCGSALILGDGSESELL